MEKHQNVFLVWVMALFLGLMTLALWCKAPTDYSDSERRRLAQMPSPSLSGITSGRYMTQFESYTQDQFPGRDPLRGLKTLFSTTVLGQLDNNGLYFYDGYGAKLEYPLDEVSIAHAADRFTYLYDTCLAPNSCKVSLSVIPDKNCFLGPESGRLTMDYSALIGQLRQAMPYADYIDITQTLALSDYYKTDPHWRQEALTDTANALAQGLGIQLQEEYTVTTSDIPFYGVYAGQAALSFEPEPLRYLTSPVLEQCIVTNLENGSIGGIYDLEKAAGRDPYDLFLSGPVSLLTIDNPACPSDRELVVFRDSFASSVVPLLCEGYRKITLVDIRYLRAEYVSKMVDFHGQDVLFLYSTLVLNHSETLS